MFLTVDEFQGAPNHNLVIGEGGFSGAPGSKKKEAVVPEGLEVTPNDHTRYFNAIFRVRSMRHSLVVGNRSTIEERDYKGTLGPKIFKTRVKIYRAQQLCHESLLSPALPGSSLEARLVVLSLSAA